MAKGTTMPAPRLETQAHWRHVLQKEQWRRRPWWHRVRRHEQLAAGHGMSVQGVSFCTLKGALDCALAVFVMRSKSHRGPLSSRHSKQPLTIHLLCWPLSFHLPPPYLLWDESGILRERQRWLCMLKRLLALKLLGIASQHGGRPV
eukprot:1155365-Pelagomonas_calceolata.AAC.9